MRVTEYRIPMPISVDEFRMGLRYANWRSQAELSKGQSEGGETLERENFWHETYGEGRWNRTRIRLGDRVPRWVVSMAPPASLEIEENCWCSHPYCKTVLSAPYFSKFRLEILTLCCEEEELPNALALSDADLAMRRIEHIDIAQDPVPRSDYRADLDPTLYRSAKTGRGPLSHSWLSQARATPSCCVYKVVRAQCAYWGVQV